MIYNLWWQASTDGTTFTNMPSPSAFKYTPNDLDNDSYRSVVTGVLIRNRIRSRVGKWEMDFNAITSTDLNTILTMTANESFYVQIRVGGSLSASKTVYAGSPSIEGIQGTDRFNLSISLVEY